MSELLLRHLNQARSLLRDAEDESTNGITANAKFIDQRVTEARETIDNAILIAYRATQRECEEVSGRGGSDGRALD